MAAVSVALSSGRPSKALRSTGSPTTTREVFRGKTWKRLAYRGKTSWAPQWAIGTTGMPLSSAIRAAPVWPFIGHRSGIPGQRALG